MHRRAALATLGTVAMSGCLRLQEGNGSGNEINLAEQWTKELFNSPFIRDDHIVFERSSRGGGFVAFVDVNGNEGYTTEELGGEYILDLKTGNGMAATETAVYATGHNRSDSARLAAFDPDSGDREWTHETSPTESQNYIPHIAADGEQVYYAGTTMGFGSGNPSKDAVVRGISAVDGSINWETEFGDEIFRGLELFNSQLVIGFGNTLRMLDTSSGTVIWEDNLDEWTDDGFIRIDNLVYTIDNKIRAHDLEIRSQVWSMERDREPDTESIVSDNTLYSATNPGTLTAHNLDTQTKLWEVTLDHSIETQPAVSNSVVFVGDFQGNFSGIDRDSGEVVYTNQRNAQRIYLTAIDDFLCVSALTQDDSFARGYEITS